VRASETGNVQFFYNGFTQEGNNRSYSFKAVEEHQPAVLYTIRVDLALFAKYQVSLQNGPMFCLHLLQAGCSGDGQMCPGCTYRAVDSDFAGVLAERAAQAAAAASKKVARRPFRKPQPSSQLHRYLR
jgi:hypothetical protein